MRTLTIAIALLLAAHLGLLLVHPAQAGTAALGPGLNIGVVFDIGGRGDKSFNDGASRGAQRAVAAFGAHIHYIEPGDGSDREAGLRLLAAEKMDLIIGVGFIFSDDLTQTAREYPKIRFAGVDYSLTADEHGNVVAPPPNLAALKFREEQGSFLVGASPRWWADRRSSASSAAWTSP